MPPAFLTGIFTAFMLVVALVTAARLVVAWAWRRGGIALDGDISHLLMAVAMAVMLTPGPPTLSDAAWAVVFGLLTAWFGYQAARGARVSGPRDLAGGSCAPHLVHCAAMLYMFLAITATGGRMRGMAGMGGASGAGMHMLRYPTLAFAFALILIGYAVRDLDQWPVASGRLSVAAAQPVLAGAVAGNGGTRANLAAASAGTGQVLAGEAVRDISGAERAVLSGAVTTACRVAMGVTMALMLFLMI